MDVESLSARHAERSRGGDPAEPHAQAAASRPVPRERPELDAWSDVAVLGARTIPRITSAGAPGLVDVSCGTSRCSRCLGRGWTASMGTSTRSGNPTLLARSRAWRRSSTQNDRGRTGAASGARIAHRAAFEQQPPDVPLARLDGGDGMARWTKVAGVRLHRAPRSVVYPSRTHIYFVTRFGLNYPGTSTVEDQARESRRRPSALARLIRQMK